MRGVVKLRPVLFACAGCEEHGTLAARVAAELDRRNLAESTTLCSEGLAKARCRFPVYTLEGCERACARQWLRGRGVEVQRSDVLEASSRASNPARLADGLAAAW